MPGVRDYRLDNAKGILIILVFYAHLLSTVLQTSHVLIWYLIYLFHMPAFLMISGFLSARRIDNREYGKAIVKILIPYLLVQFSLYLLFYCTQTYKELWVDSEGRMVWMQPSGALWYLLALFIYIILTSVVSRSKNRHILWIVLAISVLLSLSAGLFYTCWYLRFTKMVCFYPFFLLGYMLSRNESYDRLVNFKFSKIVGLILFLAGFGIALAAYFILKDKINLFGVLPMESRGAYFQVLNDSEYYYIKGPLVRLLFILLAVLISFGLICLVPRKSTVLAYLGKHSMYIYILHWFCIRCLVIAFDKGNSAVLADIFRFFATDYREIWLLLPLTIAGCFILSSKPVRFIFRPFLQPDIDLKQVLEKVMGKA